jgi:hypothetical protein
VPATCPMSKSLTVLRAYPTDKQPGHLPASVPVRRIPALIPKLIVRPGHIPGTNAPSPAARR